MGLSEARSFSKEEMRHHAERYDDSPHESGLRDELSELLRASAQRIIRQAVEVELGAFLQKHSAARDAQISHN